MRLQPFAIAVVVLLAGAGFALSDSEAGEVVDPSAVPIVNGQYAGPHDSETVLPRATFGQLTPEAIQSIDFDGQVAPCSFVDTVALTSEYFVQGVVFRGPGGFDGGAILDECGNFGVTGYSPPNFFAFNTASALNNGGVPQGPETLTFGPVCSYVRIKAGGALAGTIRLECFDVLHASLGSVSLAGTANLQELQLAAPGIASCVLSFTGTVAVFDDLEYGQGSVTVPVAVAENDYSSSVEHDYLSLALASAGYLPVDVTSVAGAAAAGAEALVVYPSGYFGAGLAPTDLASWVDAGHGLIQIGDWHPYIPNAWVGQLPTPTIVDVTLNDRGHPVTHGLDAAWGGRGFFYYGWSDGAFGYTLDMMGETDLANLSAAGFPAHDFGIAALERDLGIGRSGRAIYLGLNLGGPAAGANEHRLLGQALEWVTGSELFSDSFEYGTVAAWSGTGP